MKCRKTKQQPKPEPELEPFFPVESDPFMEEADYTMRAVQEGYWTVKKGNTNNVTKVRFRADFRYRDYKQTIREGTKQDSRTLLEKLKQKHRR